MLKHVLLKSWLLTNLGIKLAEIYPIEAVIGVDLDKGEILVPKILLIHKLSQVIVPLILH